MADHIRGTMAGVASDVVFWLSYVSTRCRLYELNTGKKITIRAASKILANVLFSYRGRGLVVGSILAGCDQDGPSMFYIGSEG